MKKISEHDVFHHTANIKKLMNRLIGHLRDDVKEVDDPKAQALFETSAEVLQGLVKAFSDYEEGQEDAWK